MYESLFLRAHAPTRSENEVEGWEEEEEEEGEEGALVVTRERCVFDVKARILRLRACVCVCARVCVGLGRLTSLFPSLSWEMQSASNCASFSNLSRTDLQVTRQQTKKEFNLVCLS